MTPFWQKYNATWDEDRDTAPDSYWASYTDLMAGLLMIFALTTIITLLDIGHRLIEPTRVVKEWEKVVKEICHDPDLAKMKNVRVDCNTGALIISDEHLRFGFNQTSLEEEAKNVLRMAVPKYLEIIFRHKEFLKRIDVIEISGHTDRRDSNKVNPRVSRERAGQVLDFLLYEPDMSLYADFLQSKAITAGYSDTRFPLNDCPQDICKSARRVEIMIRLNDTDVLRDFLKILRQIIGEK